MCSDIQNIPHGWLLEALDYSPHIASIHYHTIWFIRVRCDDDRCNISGEPMSWTGRKWYVSSHSTVSEVVQTVLKAVLTAIEHEVREQLTFRGERVFDPHMNLEEPVRATVHRLRLAPSP